MTGMNTMRTAWIRERGDTMAIILNDEVTAKIKGLRREIRKLNLPGWLCEGYDWSSNMIFNNDTGQYIIADYNGQILSMSRNLVLTKSLKKLAELEGEIALLGR